MRYAEKLLALCVAIFASPFFGNLALAQDKTFEKEASINDRPPRLLNNVVIPDEKTAKKVAEAILVPIYGRDAIETQKPFNVFLLGDIWVLTGYLPPDQLGGVFRINISKTNGCVIQVTHGK